MKTEMMIKCKLPNHLLASDKTEVVVNILGYGEIVDGLPSFKPTSFTFSPVQFSKIIDQVGAYNYCLETSLDAYKNHLITRYNHNLNAQA